MSAPLLSVLTTIYNREKYLAECIDSVLASDFTDFEHVLVDDVSQDGSAAIAETYAAKDARIRFYRNAQNLGDYPNRNRAAAHARGKYLKYLDSDDTIRPNALTNMVAAMERFPEAAVGLVSHRDKITEPQLIEPREAYRRHFLRHGGFFTHSPLTSIIRRDAFEAMGGFLNVWQVGDYDFWLRTGAKRPIVLLPSGLIGIYREHGDQQVAFIKQLERLKLNYAAEKRALTAADCPLSVAERQEALNRLKKYYAVFALTSARQGHLQEAGKLYRQHELTLRHLLGALTDRFKPTAL